MQEILTMNQKERERIKILEQVEEGKLTVKEASEILCISERQLYRIKERYCTEGDKGVIHRSRGSPSNRGYPERLKKMVIKIYRDQYGDFGPTLFSEKLLEYHRYGIDHETLRRWMRASGIGTSQRKKRPHRRKRERRGAIGEMLQFDGSHHDWFEGRGERCCLLHGVDDASSKVYLRFSPSENTEEVLRTMKGYCQTNGIPHSIYTDKYSVYYEDKKLTDFGLAMQKLQVKTIFAKSSQAKGRVERGNRTLQDRLVKELRLKGISTIGEANRFIREHFLDDYNRRFSNSEGLADIHRPINGYNLNDVFCFEESRQVRNDYTITLNSRYIQLEKSEAPLPLPRQYVIIRKYLDETLHIFHNENELNFTLLNEKPKPRERTITKPGKDHPWRKYKIGKTGNV